MRFKPQEVAILKVVEEVLKPRPRSKHLPKLEMSLVRTTNALLSIARLLRSRWTTPEQWI